MTDLMLPEKRYFCGQNRTWSMASCFANPKRQSLNRPNRLQAKFLWRNNGDVALKSLQVYAEKRDYINRFNWKPDRLKCSALTQPWWWSRLRLHSSRWTRLKLAPHSVWKHRVAGRGDRGRKPTSRENKLRTGDHVSFGHGLEDSHSLPQPAAFSPLSASDDLLPWESVSSGDVSSSLSVDDDVAGSSRKKTRRRSSRYSCSGSASLAGESGWSDSSSRTAGDSSMLSSAKSTANFMGYQHVRKFCRDKQQTSQAYLGSCRKSWLALQLMGLPLLRLQTHLSCHPSRPFA